jgi:predicted SprT family Zn-dependent metalloprotease
MNLTAPVIPVSTTSALSPARAREVQQLAYDLLTAHGLSNWSFAFNRRKRAMGYCYYGRKVIELSIYFVERNPDVVIRDTLLHEIAHALVGADHGHDEVWKQKCLEVGARPERFGHAEMPPGRWRARCDNCGKHFHRHRRPKRLHGWYCLHCGLERGSLVWQLHAASPAERFALPSRC